MANVALSLGELKLIHTCIYFFLKKQNSTKDTPKDASTSQSVHFYSQALKKYLNQNCNIWVF